MPVPTPPIPTLPTPTTPVTLAQAIAWATKGLTDNGSKFIKTSPFHVLVSGARVIS